MNVTFLLVDDDPAVREVMSDRLTVMYPGCKIVTSHDGNHALEKLKTFEPNIIITDLKMPETNGFSLAQEILKCYPQIPVVLFTGHGDSLNRTKGFELGFAAVLDKLDPNHTIKEKIDFALSLQKVDSEYVGFEVSSFDDRETYPFDTFVKLTDGKFVHLFKAGDIINHEKIELYKTKNISTYYLKKSDFFKLDGALYVPVRTSTLKADKFIEFDVFLEKSGGVFQTIVKKQTKLSQQHVEIFKKHNVKKLFIKDHDEPLYHKYLDSTMLDIVDDKTITEEDKVATTAGYVGSSLKKAYSKVDRQSIEGIAKAGGVLDRLICESLSGSIRQLLDKNLGSSFFQHSLRVASLSLAMYQEVIELRKKSTTKALVVPFDNSVTEGKITRDLITQAALFHDIGMATLKITSPKIPDLIEDNEERRKYYDHIDEGVKLLKTYSNLPPYVIQAIAEHEEYVDGSGPKKLKRTQTTIYSQLLSLVNYYDLFLSSGHKSHDAIVHIEMVMKEKFNPHWLMILKRVIK